MPPSRKYSYLVELLPDGRWRWTVFREDRNAVKSGSAKDEREAKLHALHSIEALKIQDRKGSI
jgi:hypothetical protein